MSPRTLSIMVALLTVACTRGEPLLVDEPPVAGPEHAAAIAQAKLEYVEAMVVCLQLRGFDVSVNDDGNGISSRNVGIVEYFKQSDECEGELVAAGRIEPPATASREYFEGAYEYNLTVKACLEAEGYTVSEPPTKDSYVESQGENWVPYDAVVTNSLAEWEEINRLCPQDYRPY